MSVKSLQGNDLSRMFPSRGWIPLGGLHPRLAGCIYPSRFGCDSSRSMALVIPLMNLKRELPGVTAQRWQGEPGLGTPGEPDGGGRWPPPKSPTERALGHLRPRSAWHERREGDRSSRLHEGGPKQGPESRQRSWGDWTKPVSFATDPREEAAREAACCDSGRFAFSPRISDQR